jgi:hypothetical protein
LSEQSKRFSVTWVEVIFAVVVAGLFDESMLVGAGHGYYQLIATAHSTTCQEWS